MLLDRDVAALYGVETKHINQAVRNNPGKFPAGYKFQLDAEEFANWRSKILTTNLTGEERSGIAKGVRYVPTAFTERGLYMLATILKSPCAVSATLAIVETYAQVRSMVRDMEALQTLKDGSPEQAAQLSKAGHRLATLIGDNLSTEATK
ncbi:MAG: ORF6N domain-containing protein, partial [Victivallales bacterium]|nr:ORF6N domain-containing protein [Victivallales bacterium]